MLLFRIIKRTSLMLFIVLNTLLISCFLPTLADATVLYTADTAGSVIVQSRRTLRDQQRHSWQVVAFKPIEADGREGEVYLRLIGFPGTVTIDHSQPIWLTGLNGQSLTVANISDRISQNPLQPHVGQYNLQAALPALPIEDRLQLDLPLLPEAEFTASVATDIAAPATLQISPAQLEEWQTVANIHVSDLIHACHKFPTEALQNPAFPDWLKCK